MVAYGSLLVPAKVFNILRTTWDHSVVFSRRGNGFAIRLLAPAGRPVMASLLEKLQRLECVLSVLEVLQRKKMSPQSLSLSHVAFKYGPEKDLSASIDIGLSSPLFHEDAKSVNGVSQTDPLFCLRLGINFGCSNPHRRIQRSLTTILNRSSTDAGLDAVTELLSLTLPLLQAVDEIMNNPSHKGPLKVQVIARNAKAFIIHYPIQELRFQLVASQHLGHMVWTLRDKSSSHDLSNKELRSSDSWKRLYSSRGDGWRGLGNGVIAEVDKIGNLISELDRYFSSSSRDHLGPKNSGADTTSIGLSNSAESQTVQLGGAEGTESMSQAGLTPTTRMSGEHMQSMAGPIPQNTDIIMID
ncbi:hypothetical protein EYZ11_005023 [Aspergillus tanneri]|nr:hypothetical protein EYZ11_005023 [Aspergillus tanneri]